MKWTTELPTVEGFYWMRSVHLGCRAPLIVELEYTPSGWLVNPDGVAERLGDLIGYRQMEWAGPIPEPEEA